MQGTYALYWQQAQIGTVELTRCGLYYHLRCRCRKNGAEMLELAASAEGETSALGVLVPRNGEWMLDKDIPAKRFATVPTFFLRVRGEAPEETVAVNENEPFAFLERLDEAYLVRVGDEVRIAFRKNRGKAENGT